MSPKILTFKVGNLPATATTQDVRNHFLALRPDCAADVRSFVKNSAAHGNIPDTYTATVDLKISVPALKSLQTCIDDTKSAHLRRRFFSGSQETHISIDETFHGVTTLYEHPEGSEIDIYFIHGLCGHAFNTFTNRVEGDDTSSVRNWARDFLPDDLRRLGIRARIMTIGYNANVMAGVDPQASIRTIAEALLAVLRQDRGSHNKRPMSFVCHSLGGLVVCQALILALHSDAMYGLERGQYQGLFLDGNICNIRGISFLATPFQGSLTAANVAPILTFVKALNPSPMNIDLAKDLRWGGNDLNDIVGRFRGLQTQYQFHIWIGCETFQLRTQLVVNRNSAVATFGNTAWLVQTMTNTDHRSIVKFDQRDSNYESVLHGVAFMTGLQRTTGSVDDLSIPVRERVREPSPERVPVRRSTVQPTTGISNSTSPRYGATMSSSPPQDGPNARPPPILPLARVGSAPVAVKSPHSNVIDDNSRLSRLRDYDTVFILDDTGSMQLPADSRRQEHYPGQVSPNRWSELQDCMEDVLEIVLKYDEDGIDVQFLKSTDLNCYNVKDSNALRDTLTKAGRRLDQPSNAGGTAFAKELDGALAPRVNRWRDYDMARSRITEVGQRPARPKGMNLIVMTDGEAQDHEDVEDLIANAARDLDLTRAPPSYIGIQFIQVGDHQPAAEWLKMLDDELSSKSKDGKFRDMVDTTPWSSDRAHQAHDEMQEKLLLGSVYRFIDRRVNQPIDHSQVSAEASLPDGTPELSATASVRRG